MNFIFFFSHLFNVALVTLTHSEVFGSFIKLWSVRTGSMLSIYSIRLFDYKEENPKLICLDENKFGVVTKTKLYQFGLKEAPTVWSEDSSPMLDTKFDGTQLWVVSHRGDGLYLLRFNSNPIPVTSLVYPTKNRISSSRLVLIKGVPKFLIVQSGLKVHLLEILNDLTSKKISLTFPSKNSDTIGFSIHSHYLWINAGQSTTIYSLESNPPTQIYRGDQVFNISPGLKSLYLLFPNHISKISNTPNAPIKTLNGSSSKDLVFHDLSTSINSEKLLCTTLEGHIELWENDELKWTRYESLASPKKAFVLDFPSKHMWEEEKEMVVNIFQRWFDRWSLHWQQLKRLEFLNPSHSHYFDFSKLLVVWTEQNLIYALESSSKGTVKWWKKLPNDIYKVQLSNPTRGSDPALLMLKGSKQTLFLQPFSGEILNAAAPENLEKNLKRIQNLYSPSISSFYTYTLSPNGKLTGFKKNNSSSSATQLYELNFEDPILKTAKVDQSHHVTSQGRIMFADRSVQYKYLNPHLISILTGANSTIKLYFVDVVSGHKLFTFQTKEVDLTLSVHLLSVENWTVLLYWNSEAGWVATVIDLYESYRPGGPFSSFTTGTPETSIASFVLPIRDFITGIGVTCTRNNIASRDLIYTTDRFIGSISRKFLDGLRSMTHPPENDIPAYEPVLPLDDKHVLSKGLLVKTHRIITHPTELESTSIILAYGHDLFWTSITPSGSFDKLSSNFPKMGLMATCLGLFISVIFSRYMLRRKQLNIQWH
ncbi:hypothetical protein HMI55_000904 [Coelomomyces lativittatus]|nr:hypothetical protein HMI55_000904 [Coelomomyces lativittatus]